MEADLLHQTSLIIIDKITMQHRYAAEAIDRLLQDIKGSDRLFGGVTVVFGGDFQQILPVIVKGSRPQIVGACIQRSSIWRHLQILNLTINMRLQAAQDPEERAFARWQLDVGHGRQTDKDGNINLPQWFHCPQNTVESLIDTIYPGVDAMPHPHDNYFSECSILSAKNDDVDELNKRILDTFPGEERVYHSADSIKETRDEDGNELMYPTESLNSINVSGLPLAKFALKEGCPVMILCNLNPQEGVCNGTRGIVTRFGNHVIEVRIIGGSFAGRHIVIPRLKIEPTNAPIPFQLCCLQFPLRLAFAMTINKSQGQSLNYVGIDNRSPIFTHGQVYVAVSHSTSVHRMKAIWPPNSPPTSKNIVYPEVLLD